MKHNYSDTHKSYEPACADCMNARAGTVQLTPPSTWEQRFDEDIMKFLVTRTSQKVVRAFIDQEITRAREEERATINRQLMILHDQIRAGNTDGTAELRTLILTPSAEGEDITRE